MEPGVCYIKPEYLVEEKESAETETTEQENKKTNSESTGVRIRKRGKNKDRPVYKVNRSLLLCSTLINGPAEQKCREQQCRYVHDLKKFMTTKGEDLGDKCPVYEDKGFCPRGVTCRFAKSHLDAEGRNVKSPQYNEHQRPTVWNGVTKRLQMSLRRRTFDFSRSRKLVAHFDTLRKEANNKKNEKENPVGSCVDEDETTGRDEKKTKPVDFANKLILAPLTTVGNLPFRRICKEFGADITCSEMACCVPLLKGVLQEWALTKRHESEDIFGVQLCGSNANLIAQTTQLLEETVRADFIDLNIGCPIELIYEHGGGCALMKKKNVLEVAIRACSALYDRIPFTVKMRTGVNTTNIAHDLIPLVEEWGASAVTLHGRSREQRYKKSADWEYIEKCASQVKSIPVIGNGDILCYEDYIQKKDIAPHVSSVMIGRGALIKPWIFKEIKEQKTWNPSSSERFEIMRKYVNYGLEHFGSDTQGVENTRRFLLEWQSFLYRYVPYELLLYPPQKINQRPQSFRGRDEMETLMSSPNSQDWVKLSEMLLGPVPKDYTFVPKHKANAY